MGYPACSFPSLSYVQVLPRQSRLFRQVDIVPQSEHWIRTRTTMSTATNMDPAYNNRALPGTVIFSFILLTVATVIVSLRVYTRAWVKSVAGWDDILIIPALVSPSMESPGPRLRPL